MHARYGIIIKYSPILIELYDLPSFRFFRFNYSSSCYLIQYFFYIIYVIRQFNIIKKYIAHMLIFINTNFVSLSYLFYFCLKALLFALTSIVHSIDFYFCIDAATDAFIFVFADIGLSII
ncbi:LOW QUALITY PROTEIN: uncharacterized protein T551_03664 [Pneumocystis jirovecii RU7]|uniref:Uncharacterized protein n=1 Tax=Pneumocystis jirovecii (strain RU7) TaxID=1408657 RepID=A0A0W4ZBL6_PNEJ7|nr:LOW QUALITY PROTEIN: uncharacterized protein T551_03664 [Pneumocystis jirovecii RU7]KTW25828.1 LOW QUALITY PROTEIN: hypothetical protein T551_03664 [Pneumocystis jirovecii RU7]